MFLSARDRALAFAFVSMIVPAQAQPPKIAAVTNAGYFAGNTLAPGTFVSIYGENLAPATTAATTVPFPTKLSGVEVLLCSLSQSAPACTPQGIVFVSPGQVNFLLDYGERRSGYIAVRVDGRLDADYAAGNRGYPVQVIRNEVTPGVFAAGFDCPAGGAAPCGLSATRQGEQQIMRPMITDSTFQPIFSGRPAHPGAAAIIWATGLGFPGVSGDLQPRVRLELAVRFRLNGTGAPSTLSVPILFAGAAPGFAGLYQVNYLLPVELARAAGACGTASEATLELGSLTTTLSLPLVVRADPLSGGCR